MAYYVQLDSDYWDHPKTLRLISLMGPRGENIPLKMWSWAARFKVSGTFDSVEQLALSCRYKGQPDRLQKALMQSGFIDADGLTIHDWKTRTGHGILMYEREKQRQREKAERSRAKKEEESTPGTYHGTSPGTSLGTSHQSTPVRTTITVPDLTGPDRTVPDQPPPPPAGGNGSAARRSRKKPRPSLDDIEREIKNEGASA